MTEFERDIIRNRTKAGLEAARKRGRLVDRPKIMDKKKITLAKAMYKDKSNSVDSIYDVLKISKTTLSGYLKKE